MNPEGRGGQGVRTPPGKSQVAISFPSTIGTDPLEKQLDHLFQLLLEEVSYGTFCEIRWWLKKCCQESPFTPIEFSGSMWKNTYSVCAAVNWGGGGRNPRYFVSWFAHGRKWKENWPRIICDIHYQYTNSMLSVYVVIFPSMMTVLLLKVPRPLKTFWIMSFAHLQTSMLSDPIRLNWVYALQCMQHACLTVLVLYS